MVADSGVSDPQKLDELGRLVQTYAERVSPTFGPDDNPAGSSWTGWKMRKDEEDKLKRLEEVSEEHESEDWNDNDDSDDGDNNEESIASSIALEVGAKEEFHSEQH